MKSVLLYKQPKTLLNKGTGFLSGYSHSLNPYTGCAFACSYCYVRGMPVSIFRGQEWGSWVDVKLNAAELLKKELRKTKAKGPVTIFMSSSTDPYQPAEYKEQVTRSLLEAMAEEPPDFLLVQTRSPLVTRDIDLLHRLGSRVRVSMTVETDLEAIRKHFSPMAPPIQARLKALQLLKEAGVPTQAAVAPLLPSSEAFAGKLAPLVDRVCIDDYFMGDGSGGKRTMRLGLETLYAQLGAEEWNEPSAYEAVYRQFREVFGEEQLFISQAGFEP
ncbi:DNA photolyase [Paenibacillus sp. BIHB 4019]|uniref:DNA photolyase n=1 Tax=Paenibacillus sp. BIHB 4019 TaxID=1870819 RepID=A0A1B2DR49_9BACL|nr:radical SAM protein [Paenibacillus sp. BIHB 4019]ANY70170.1 DNA photolyase [Paenibacillus sp. BIHB 4019]